MIIISNIFNISTIKVFSFEALKGWAPATWEAQTAYNNYLK